MGLIISEEEANARLNNPDNLAKKMGIDPENDRKTKTSTLQDSYNKPRENGPNDDADQTVSVRPIHNGGRREGDTNVPELVRNVAAILANNGETTQSIAQAFGISKTSVDQYKDGNTSFGRPNAGLRTVIRENLEKIQEKVVTKMVKGVDFLDFDDEEKMKKVSYRDMSHILLNLSKFVDPSLGEPEKKDSTKLIVYAPTVRNENHFEIVETRE